MCNPIRLAVLVSGSGTNLQAIIDAIAAGQLNAQITMVISDNPAAYGLERAKAQGIPTQCIVRKNYASREDFELAMVEALQSAGVELVLLAGFMRVLSKVFLQHFAGRVMNIHPSLLPAFPGLDAQKQALEYGVKVTGCTVHFVDEGMDTGPIILQAAVPVLEGDTRDELAARILREEHRLYAEAVRLYHEGRLQVEGGMVKVKVR